MLRRVARSLRSVRHALTARSIAFTIVCGVGVFTNSVDVHCQDCSVGHDLTTPPQPQGFFSVPSPAVCHDDAGNLTNDQTLPNGGYVKLNTPVRVDTEAHVGGNCDVQTWDPWWQRCVWWYNEIRYLIGVTVWTIPPTMTAWYQTAAAAYGATSLDTRSGQGLLNNLSELGQFRFTFQSGAYNTHCSPVMYSDSIEKIVDAVSCLPKWKKDNNGNLARFPLDATPITIAYPASIAAEAEPAIDDWKAKLAQRGLSLTINKVPDGGCAVGDGHCVLILLGKICPIFPDACGCRIPGGSPAGVYTTRNEIWLKTGYDSWPPAYRRYVIAHELGHAFSLEHRLQNEGCADPPGSVMDSASVCGTLGSVPNAPTDNDASAVARTVYSNGPLKTCGW